jgi:uncharacterized membrane protein
MRISTVAALAMVILGFIASAYFYPSMPDQMASHWGIVGEANGYMDKAVAIFLMPVITALIFLLLIVIPRIDPMKQNIQKFWKYYEGMIMLFLIFMLYLHALIIAWNLGYRFSMPQMLAPAFGLLFFYIGILIEHAKRNYSVGIRTPWTLNNDRVWEKTHKLGGKLFKASGIIAMLGVFFVGQSFYMVIIPVIACSVYIYVYSYHVYRNEPTAGKKKRR